MRGEAEVHAVQLEALLAVKKALATEVSVWYSKGLGRILLLQWHAVYLAPCTCVELLT